MYSLLVDLDADFHNEEGTRFSRTIPHKTSTNSIRVNSSFIEWIVWSNKEKSSSEILNLLFPADRINKLRSGGDMEDASIYMSFFKYNDTIILEKRNFIRFAE